MSLTLEYLIKTRNEGNHLPPLLLLQVKGKKTTLILVPGTSQPSPHINVHCKSLCMGPAGTWGSTDTSLGKKSWVSVHLHLYFFELNGLRGWERFYSFPPNHFSTSLAPTSGKKLLVQCKIRLQGKKKSHEFLSSCLQQELHYPVLIKQLSAHSYIWERKKKEGSLNDLVEVGEGRKIHALFAALKYKNGLSFGGNWINSYINVPFASLFSLFPAWYQQYWKASAWQNNQMRYLVRWLICTL